MTRAPTRDETGIPCHTDECPEYDGKRCGELGMRPGRHCETALFEDYEARDDLLAACKAALAEFESCSCFCVNQNSGGCLACTENSGCDTFRVGDQLRAAVERAGAGKP